MVWRQLTSRYPTQHLRREMDRLLTDFFGNMGELPWSTGGPGRPAVNTWEAADSLFVEMEVPGVKSDHVDISVVGNELAVKIERPDMAQEGMTYHRRERGVGTFARVLRLPVEVDSGRVEADLRNGILTITLPKAPTARPHKIRVSAAP